MLGGLALPLQCVSLPMSSLGSSLDPPREGLGVSWIHLAECGRGGGGRGPGQGSTLRLGRREMCAHLKAKLLSPRSSPCRGQPCCHESLPVLPCQAWRRLSWQPRQSHEQTSAAPTASLHWLMTPGRGNWPLNGHTPLSRWENRGPGEAGARRTRGFFLLLELHARCLWLL